MSLPFITRHPSADEAAHLRLALSIFGDGSGYQREPDGSSRAGPREIERAVATVLHGSCVENKAVFDVVAPGSRRDTDVGISVKSKELPAKFFREFGPEQRVYMELCNSPAKLWEPLHAMGITEDAFRKGQKPQVIGDSVIQTVRSWWQSAADDHKNALGRKLDLDRSVFLVLSCSPWDRHTSRRQYIAQSYPLAFPEGIVWRFAAGRQGAFKCLKGFDPQFPGEVLFDWYGVSGGQLKYYPRSGTSLFATSIFELLGVPPETVNGKIARLFPEESRGLGLT
jgi:hypothetical protein